MSQERHLNINVEQHAGTVKFKVDADKDASHPAWPNELFPLQSVPHLTYMDVYAAFTDEDTFHSLQAVSEISGSFQRYFGPIEDPNGDGKLTAIKISLAGIIPADQLMALYDKTGEAGHWMLPVVTCSTEGNTYSVFTLIPQYRM